MKKLKSTEKKTVQQLKKELKAASDKEVENLEQRFSALFSKITGRIGNRIYKRINNKTVIVPYYGKIYRANSKGNEIITIIYNIWKSMKYAERERWCEFARHNKLYNSYGQSVYVAGRDFFIHCNYGLFLVGLPFRTEVPATNKVLYISKLNLKIEKEKDRIKDIKLFFYPEIDENIRILFRSSPFFSLKKQNRLSRKYYDIKVLDTNFKSGESVKEAFLKYIDEKDLLKQGKLCIRFKVVNIQSGMSRFVDRLLEI